VVDDQHFNRGAAAGFDFEAQSCYTVVHEARAGIRKRDLGIGDPFRIDFVVDGEIIHALKACRVDDETLVVVIRQIVGEVFKGDATALNGDVVAERAAVEVESGRIRIGDLDGLEFGGFAEDKGIDTDFAALSVEAKTEAFRK